LVGTATALLIFGKIYLDRQAVCCDDNIPRINKDKQVCPWGVCIKGIRESGRG
jgi:hypothetical protein